MAKLCKKQEETKGNRMRIISRQYKIILSPEKSLLVYGKIPMWYSKTWGSEEEA